MGKNQDKFSNEQWQYLQAFKRNAEAAEAEQLEDLLTNCTNKFQFAKTYTQYEKDWNQTKRHMLAQQGKENAPKPHVLDEMIAIGERLIEAKKSRMAEHFQTTWNESIFNYIKLQNSAPNTKVVDLSVKNLSHKWIAVLVLFALLVLLPVVLHQLR